MGAFTPISKYRDKNAADPVEYWREVLLRLGWPPMLGQQRLQSIAFTGCRSGDGVSTVAINTAITAARTGQGRVLLVDCNPSNPMLAATFRADSAPGLSEAFRGIVDPADAIQQTEFPNLSLLTLGDAKAFDSAEMAQSPELIKHLLADHDLVISDVPPVLDQPQLAAWLAVMDRTVVVVAEGAIDSRRAKQLQVGLHELGISVFGVILNKRFPRR